ncbi:sensor histidine kinase [Gracilibacillus kekensis]|uniref:histidine kinase n=1 Tax=Gracilibacillus kekensis TaxID=1027249 RepID=A0A1M7KY36_9BACI|nr:sensor histidine kinase [Gracilibacillus kekensis]SHM70482.1 Signal transduction histidine kinase [Gracilibacillus kekensis]
MDNFVEKKMPIAILITQLIMVPLFALDDQANLTFLYFMVGIYVMIQFLRDFVFRVNLDDQTGVYYLITQLLLLAVLISVDQSFISQVFLLILIGEMVYHHSLTSSIIFTSFAYMSFVLGKWIAFDFPSLSSMTFIIPRITEFLVVFTFSYLVKLSINQKHQLQKAYEKMKLSTLQLEEKTIMQERKRFAREMHDSIGHSFSTSLIGLNAVKTLISSEQDQAKNMLNQVYRNLEEGLQEVRKSVRNLQESHFFIDFYQAVSSLIQETIEQTGVVIESEINVRKFSLIPRQEIVIYRALQEGVTNGLRHGKANRFHVYLVTNKEGILFRLSDNGNAIENFEENLGFGLMAMKERVEELNGVIKIHSINTKLGGADIIIELPHLEDNNAKSHENAG